MQTTSTKPTVELCLSLSRQLERALTENEILRERLAAYDRLLALIRQPSPVHITNDNRTTP